MNRRTTASRSPGVQASVLERLHEPAAGRRTPERAGDDDLVAGLAPRIAGSLGPGATSPTTVTVIESVPEPRVRLPPTSHSACSSHASRIPPNSSITQAASTSSDSVSAHKAYRGLAAIAAMSLRLTIIAL